MRFPPFILPRLTVDRALTQPCNQWLTRVISLYICTLKTHICTRYLAHRVINTYLYGDTVGVTLQFQACPSPHCGLGKENNM